MPPGQLDEHVLERGGVGAQLGELRVLAVQLVQEGGNGAMELRDPDPPGAISPRRRAHACYRLQGALVQSRRGHDRELHHVLRAQRRHQLAGRSQGDDAPVIDDGDSGLFRKWGTVGANEDAPGYAKLISAASLLLWIAIVIIGRYIPLGEST